MPAKPGGQPRTSCVKDSVPTGHRLIHQVFDAWPQPLHCHADHVNKQSYCNVGLSHTADFPLNVNKQSSLDRVQRRYMVIVTPAHLVVFCHVLPPMHMMLIRSCLTQDQGQLNLDTTCAVCDQGRWILGPIPCPSFCSYATAAHLKS